MTFNNFVIEFGLLIKSSRKMKNLTLYQYAFNTDIVADHIQKIESSKHGGIQILTYAKLLSGLECSLSFSQNNKKCDKLIVLSNGNEKFINNLFFGFASHPDFQFLNFKPSNLLVQLGKQISNKRNSVGWTQKELAEKAGISNTTVSRIESGKYNYSLLVLHKLSKALHTK